MLPPDPWSPRVEIPLIVPDPVLDNPALFLFSCAFSTAITFRGCGCFGFFLVDERRVHRLCTNSKLETDRFSL